MKTIITLSFRTIFFNLFVFLIFHSRTPAQSCYNPFVDSVISRVTLASISKFNRELTGDTSAIIGGQPYTIISRYYLHPSNQKAAQYIFEKFQSYGLNPYYQPYSLTGVNVIAKKLGVKYPNKQLIICGHYDNIISPPPVPDTVHGADDNASGTCAVIEAARVLSLYNLDYTIIFAAWDEEEIGLYGSDYYASLAYSNGDSILGVINLDMIGWDGNNDNKYRVITNTSSIFYANVLESASLVYLPVLDPRVVISTGGGSDHYSFWLKGFKAITGIENYPDFNPYYHTIGDNYSHLNLSYFERLVKTSVAALAILNFDYIINFEHNPLQSAYDTTSRVAIVVITSNHRIVKSFYAKRIKYPRLYYKIGEGTFNYVYPSSVNLDTFKFLIPGQPRGTKVSYYIAAQDSLSTLIGSLPAGARGLDPPGTVPPPRLFTYYILNQYNQCSNTVPKNLSTRAIIYDSIFIPQTGTVFDINVNLTIYHSNDEDLYIWLTRPGYSLLPLSSGNGGSGANYINTTFDDEASDSITQGSPPFTGSFKPESPLSTFDNSQLQSLWRLRILNNSQTITGQLVNWCINFQYLDPISVANNQMPVQYSLSQNYPNPFNSSTSINYSLIKQSQVRIVVYDVLGREVKTLINNRLSAGDYVMSFNANELSSGLYFYSMYIDGVLFETKKMVLIK